jgi:hypothetical protein
VPHIPQPDLFLGRKRPGAPQHDPAVLDQRLLGLLRVSRQEHAPHQIVRARHDGAEQLAVAVLPVRPSRAMIARSSSSSTVGILVLLAHVGRGADPTCGPPLDKSVERRAVVYLQIAGVEAETHLL